MSLRVTALLLALAMSGAAFGDDADPPGRVGRLSLIQGQVVIQASGAGAPEEAELNHPLTLGDRLMTDTGSRAELSVGTAAVRLDESSDLTIANLDHDITQLELNSGTLGIHLRELREAETFEIDTPNATVLLLRPGDYRIEVDSQGASVLAVRNGEAELDGGAGPTRLSGQQELRFAGPDEYASVQALGPLTAFDEWCIDRERTIADAQSTRYVSRDVVGYEDLDSHGSWWNEPGYGAVWAPTYISIGWAPYSYGHWTWISPWGFTWVDYSPWGYAPFHYGRWAYLHQRWCWVPPRHHRPVFAPALVGWTGMPGIRDPRHPGSVGWFPLAPREVYVPQQRVSPRYLRNVNISNTTIDNNAQITNAYNGRVRNVRNANRDAPGALTTMPAATFTANRSGAGRVLRMNPNEPERVAPRVTTPHAAPIRDSRWRDNANVRSTETNAQPTTTLRPSVRQRSNIDARKTAPRMPTDRRVIQGNVNETRRPVSEAPAMRRVEQPRTAVQAERPPAVVRSEQQQRVVQTESWQRTQGTQANRVQSAPTRSAQPESAHSNSGGSTSAGFRSDRAGASTHSNSSTSRAQSGRTGWSANRP